ncbi:DUF1275 domain-containing protein [Altererythrobacter confluentis]|uniref:DUF1275 domain-containing protein n=1 Tax=Allopontixanthobacter confluentis TaxID=1849021 RepID=A0A6L7GGK9_9SPHN|nr:YoaK family protein [Allopontixanthobacter confluentis]MXP15193.1 DUF1275 domain-containing protein [Allopontixanthobacter confluentis]
MNRYDRSRRLLAIAIAALAGFVDASGFLAGDRYFVSFMSGNTTRLAVDLTSDIRQAMIPLGLITGFVLGVTLGAITSDRAGKWRKTAVLALSTLLLCGAALAREYGSIAAMMAALVLAMGTLNNSFRRNGEVTVGVTYMTGSLVRIGQAIAAAIQGRPLAGWASTVLLWAGLVGGAIAGAVTYSAAPYYALGLAAGWSAALALFASRIERRSAHSEI